MKRIPLPNYQLSDQTVFASCPSNIALIKYWGKYEGQIPANPSISYTLNNCKTNTHLEFFVTKGFDVHVFLEGKEQPKFGEKIKKYFYTIEPQLPWILKGKYLIHTENTFPHSSGIASSASGFGALAKALTELDAIFSGETNDQDRLQKTSFLARLGSGSACRSICDGLGVWGRTPEVEGSSDLFAVSYPKEQIHHVFRDFHDWILLVHEGQKAVSSSVGHGLMKTNPYAEQRFQEARDNFKTLKTILKTGDLSGFIRLVEHEALTLHSMMMMSEPPYILMKEATISVINKIWKFRKETGLPLFFTLDAGANIHVLFPNNEYSHQIKSFIDNELLPLTEDNGVVKDFMRF